jgi:hypothetical protein
MSRIEKKKSDDPGRKRTAPSPYMRGNAPIIKDTYVRAASSSTSPFHKATHATQLILVGLCVALQRACGAADGMTSSTTANR